MEWQGFPTNVVEVVVLVVMVVRGYALSEDDIHTMIPTLKVIAYPDLLQYKTIDEALDEKGRLMILYLTESPSEGHWVCLLKRKSTLTYFDPYGKLKPDAESQWISLIPYLYLYSFI